MASSEEEIYSIMFTSLKHPVRRRILRMLNEKPLTFMELVENIGVSSSHLTYHLENLGELIFKMDNGRYKLSSFGKATISAMKGVEEASDLEPKRLKKLSFKWKAVFAGLLVALLVLSSLSAIQFFALNELSVKQSSLEAENLQLRSWGVGTDKVTRLLRDVVNLDISKYRVSLLSNTLEYRTDFDVTEEILKYSLIGAGGSLDASFRFRNNHLSRYQLIAIESTPIMNQNPPSSILDAAKDALNRYKSYSGDAYLEQMENLLIKVNQTQSTTVTEGNMKLQITLSGANAEFLWMHTEKGIDFNSKSLRMTFENRVLTALTDGYFLFTVANTNLNINQDQAVSAARSHLKTLTWAIDGTQITGFNTHENPVSVELLPHPRGDSVALVPYWYVVLHLDKTYAGGINMAAVGLYADTGEVVDVQMLSG